MCTPVDGPASSSSHDTERPGNEYSKQSSLGTRIENDWSSKSDSTYDNRAEKNATDQSWRYRGRMSPRVEGYHGRAAPYSRDAGQRKRSEK